MPKPSDLKNLNQPASCPLESSSCNFVAARVRSKVALFSANLSGVGDRVWSRRRWTGMSINIQRNIERLVCERGWESINQSINQSQKRSPAMLRLRDAVFALRMHQRKKRVKSKDLHTYRATKPLCSGDPSLQHMISLYSSGSRESRLQHFVIFRYKCNARPSPFSIYTRYIF